VSPNEKPQKLAKSGNSKNTNLKLSDLFNRRRKELDLTLDEVERNTHIRKKYLRLLEKGDYANLSNDVYTRGYVKNYAEFLGFDTKEILKIYTKERLEYDSSIGINTKKSKARALNPIDSQTFTITPKTILVTLASIFVLIMVGYVSWQFSQLSAPPIIRLTNQDKTSTDASFVIVSGEVDSGSDVFINDSPILSSPDGSFSDRVMLINGTNQIKVSAKNKFGKESSKTIIVESTVEGLDGSTQTNLSKNKIDGVELLVEATTQAIYISAKADGKEIFKGTMLPGSKQLLKAKDSIKLSTGNAGSTSVTITNSLVADKNIGTLGQEGESKQEINFNKDTNVQ